MRITDEQQIAIFTPSTKLADEARECVENTGVFGNIPGLRVCPLSPIY